MCRFLLGLALVSVALNGLMVAADEPEVAGGSEIQELRPIPMPSIPKRNP